MVSVLNPVFEGIAGRPLGYAAVKASTLVGLTSQPVTIEVTCTRGPPLCQMVGLPEAPVREARVRISSALACLDVLMDEYAITVNLAPADVRKNGATLDLALATGVLAAVGKFPPELLEDLLVLGELSLDGSVQPMRGVLPQLSGALDGRLNTAIVPAANAREAGLFDRGTVYIASHLADVVDHLAGKRELPRAPRTTFSPGGSDPTLGDLMHVHGQSTARRALEVAAAGGHNLLMLGPPGAGKTMLARLLRTILPPLDFQEAIEATSVHSVAGLLSADKGMVTERPFRAPHHSVSDAGLVGGGSNPRPGEVSLAHHGVLFLDELPEFRRSAIEALRQPLEDGIVSIARSRFRAHFPARPLVVAAMNPCPCGFKSPGRSAHACRCSPAMVDRYRQKLSGPLLDRFDLHVLVPPVDVRALSQGSHSETSATVRERVTTARDRQLARLKRGETSRRTNSELPLDELKRITSLSEGSRKLLESAALKLGLSARAFVKVLRVARTLADLEGTETVGSGQIAEAVQGRILDRRESL
jgi:magnesium chelatase family protein